MSAELATDWKESLPEAETQADSAECPPRRGVSICDLTCDVHNDPDELLKHRFLCRGGGAMVNGPTGVGKSSFLMQAAVLRSIGRSFFGIQPARPLTSLLVQAENDDGDLVEQREGVFTGLGLTPPTNFCRRLGGSFQSSGSVCVDTTPEGRSIRRNSSLIPATAYRNRLNSMNIHRHQKI
jgi:hypothetical protein